MMTKMDIRLYERAGLYCDQGPHQGQMRVDFHGNVYMTVEEYNQHRHFTLVEERQEMPDKEISSD